MKLGAFARVFVAAILFSAYGTYVHAGVLGPCPLDLPTPLNVKVDGQVSHIIFDDNCRNVYATNRTADRVERFSMSSRVLGQPRQVRKGPMGLDISADGALMFVANHDDDSISILPLPGGPERARISTSAPRQVAALSNGTILYTTGRLGSLSSGIKRLYADPSEYSGWATRTVRQVNNDPFMRVARSLDGRIAFILGTNSTGGPFFRYAAVDGSLVEKSTPWYVSHVASDRRGDFSLVSANNYLFDGAYLYGSQRPLPEIEGRIFSGRPGFGVALDPFGRFGYQIMTRSRGPASIDVIDLKRFTRIGSLPFGENSLSVQMAQADLAISRDGTLLALVTSEGLTFIRTPAPPLPRVLAFSSSHKLYSSMLTFHNRDSVADTVYLTIFDYQTGTILGLWESPEIAPGAVAQFRIGDIEREGLAGQIAPYYSIAIGSLMKGSYGHLLLRKTDGVAVNFDSCEIGVSGSDIHLTRVLGSKAAGSTNSLLAFANTSKESSSVSLEIYDAAAGILLGTFTSPLLPPGGGQVLSIEELEQGAEPPFLPVARYVVKPKAGYEGVLQHILRDSRTGIATNLSSECQLPAGI